MDALNGALQAALRDVVPIALVLFAFQYWVLRRPFAQPVRVVLGFLLMLVGLVLLLLGLERAVFPAGEAMIEQLLARPPLGPAPSPAGSYLGVVAFAACISFAAVLAEPVLTALAERAERASGGAISALGMRFVVAAGAAAGVALGVARIVYGTPVYVYAAVLVALIVIQSRYTPAVIRPLAYDSGVAAISTIMVPLLVAIGAGLATAVPGRSLLVDGFGLVALACLTPVVAMLGYAQLAERLAHRRRPREGS
jgi:hypothetical protein